MSYALCPMPYALCPMPYALCPMPDSTSYESLKGYICLQKELLQAFRVLYC